MARLRNRIVKADFWGDGEILRWPRDKRMMYQGLWAMAEDSGCLEDDPFEWKLALFRSPMDADITVEHLQQWRDELVDAQKILPYEADGKHYFFLRTFHDHEHPRNPQRPDLPLPPWVTWEPRTIVDKNGKERTVTSYQVERDTLNAWLHGGSAVVPPSNHGVTTIPAQPRPDPSRPVPSRSGLNAEEEAAAIAGAREAPVENGGGGEEDQKAGRDDPLVWDIEAIEGWDLDQPATMAMLADLQRDYGFVNLGPVIGDVAAKARAGRLKQLPSIALRAFMRQAAEKEPIPHDKAPPDLVRPEMVASLAAMVADGARPEDLRAMCASEAEYEAVLGHCSPAKKAAS